MKRAILSIFIGFATVSMMFGQEPKVHKTLKGHTPAVICVLFSPDGNTLASSSWDSTVRLWDLTSEKNAHTSIDIFDIDSMAFSPDSKTFAFSSKGRMIWIWDLATRKEIGSIKMNDLENPGRSCVAFQPDGKNLISLSSDNNENNRSLIVWNLATCKKISTMPLGDIETNGMTFSPDCKLFATNVNSGLTELYDTATGKKRSSLHRHGDDNYHANDDITFSPRGDILAATVDAPGHETEMRLIDLWKVSDCKNILVVKGKSEFLCGLAFDPNEKIIASGSLHNSVINIWDIRSGDNISTLKGHEAIQPEYPGIHCVAISPDGKTLAAGYGDGTIELWDVQDIGKKTKNASSNSNHSLQSSSDVKTTIPQGEDKKE